MKLGYKILLFTGLLVFTGHTYHKKEIDRYEHDLRQQRITYEATLTAQELMFKEYFTNKGSKTPATAAKAVNQSKRKYLAAAIVTRESKGNYRAVGDSGKSMGLYQIQPQHWGKVPTDPKLQTAKHDWIMDQLVDNVGIPKAVERYNGQGSDARQYKKAVMSEALYLAQELAE